MSLADFIPMKRATMFFTDRYGLKRPLPPPGYLEGKIIQKTGKDGQKKSPRCPVCKQDCGMSYYGGGWVYPKAQTFYDSMDDDSGYEKLCKEFEGEMIKCHWSRYGEGECMGCRAKIWHDLIGGYVKVGKAQRYVDWKYYFMGTK